jgi:hypothetical protein
VTRETSEGQRHSIVLSETNDGAIDHFIEVLSDTYVWRSVVLAYARETEQGRQPAHAVAHQVLKGIIRMLLGGLDGIVTFEGAASLQALTRDGVPTRLMAAIARDAAVVSIATAPEDPGSARPESSLEPVAPPPDASPEKATAGRDKFSYRQAYIVEKGAQHLKFRLMGLVNDKEKKITFKVYRDRPIRPQLASVEAREWIQFVPMGRVVQVVEKELARAKRRR